ncbi:MAG: hypothetical protein QHC89_09175 [Bosea sp. (in: a-proteobacteria)]|nr:hypothetical protein [Bosea sp. (in: a-proteobacteria)]
MHELRKIMVLGLNEAVKQGRIFMDAPPTDAPTDEDGYLMTDIAGRPAVVNWDSLSSGEMRISVWWDYDHSKHPQADASGNARESFLQSQPLANENHYRRFVGVTVSGWLERKTGKHLQGKGKEHLFEVYMRRGSKELLQKLPDPKPIGYEAEGKFFM